MGKPLHVLLIEDSENDAMLIRRHIQRHGFDVSTFRVDRSADLETALASGHWDVAITDHNLPGLDSAVVLEMIRQHAPDLPVIIVSGMIGEEIAVSAMKSGAHDYIMKDNLSRLAPAIERELRDAEVRREVGLARSTIEHMAWHDALTGLFNRFEFERRVRLALESTRDGHRHSVLFLDLDQFKIVNDTCGHGAGDELLCQVATLFKTPLRDSDCLVRLGGDEFGVLVQDCMLEDALGIANRLLNLIGEFRFSWQGRQFGIGVSIGLVMLDDAGQSLADVLRHADLACYAAKDRGRNRVQVYQADDQDMQHRHGLMEWVGRLHNALETDRFRLYRQRIDGIAGQDVLGYEYLLRMTNDANDLIPPGAFIPAAERYNLMPMLDRWVVRHVFMDMINAGRGGMAFINVSGASLGEEDFLGFVHAQMVEFAIDPVRICFEITETTAIANLTVALDFITSVQRLGASVALDDFGSGLCSFSYLKHLPANYLKIDGSFVRDMLVDPLDDEIVRAIRNISRVVGVKTIAEYVESGEILQRLNELGVDYAQGFIIDRPAPLNG